MMAVVTGGSGMLGSRIARLLVERGARVRVTYRPGDSVQALGDLPVEHRPADILDGEAVAAAIEGAEVVFHTAALVSFKPALYARQMEVNVEGTRNLLAAAARAAVRRVVHTSTINTLGIPPAGTVGDEETPFNWTEHRLGYMDSKRAAEELALETARQPDGPDVVAALPGTFFGPGDVNLNAASYVRVVARSPLVVFAPPGGTTVAHVDDVAAGHLLALERGRRGGRYVLGGEPMSYRSLLLGIARALGRRRRVVVVPEEVLRGAGRVAAWLGERGLSAPLTPGMTAAICSKLYYSSRKAVSELGWSFRPADEALADSVGWCRGQGLL
jgi:dihydroflavonol-4-reductase